MNRPCASWTLYPPSIKCEPVAVGTSEQSCSSSIHCTGSARPGVSTERTAMHSPYGMELVEDCVSCNLCAEGFFCHLPKSVIEAFQPLKFTVAYPAGATLFVEGQVCRGIYILCKGRVKLSATSRQGQTLIFKIARPGEVLGLNATVSGGPHETSAETGRPCQLNFVKRDDFLKFLNEHGDACMHAAIHLSRECQQAYQQLRSFVSRSAPERIARLMLDWSHDDSVDGRVPRDQGGLDP